MTPRKAFDQGYLANEMNKAEYFFQSELHRRYRITNLFRIINTENFGPYEDREWIEELADHVGRAIKQKS